MLPGGGLIFCGLAVLMRWLLIGLLISVGALLLVAVAVARHILRQRRMQGEEALGKAGDRELDLGPIEESELK
jgi:hypothetical protein